MIRKQYIHKYKTRADENVVDYWFSESVKDANVWFTEESVGWSAQTFNRRGIDVPLQDGGVYRCRDFKVEKRSENEFTIYCEAPFASPGFVGDASA